MFGSILQFLGAAAVIVVAGAALTQFGAVIEHRTKLGGLLVGSILIAGATSLPELAIDLHAIRIDAADLAVGDLLGSSLFNLLILAVLDLTRYSHGQMLSKKSAAHALAAVVSIILTTIVALALFLGPRLDVTVLRLGPGSIALAIAYIIGIRIIYYGRQHAGTAKTGEIESVLPRLRKLGLKGGVIGYLLAAALILIAAPFLARAADDLAEQTGLGGTFFGTIFVALCTSLPEVVTTWSAVRMKAFDLALGNIFGSNCFNMLILVALDVAHDGALLAAVASTHLYTALCVVVVTSVVILGQLYGAEKRKHFLEPDALLALVLILGSFTGLYYVRG